MAGVSQPSPEMVREKAAEILSRPEYDLTTSEADRSWQVSVLVEILDWLLAPFRWISQLTEGLPSALRWLIMLALFVLAVVLIWHIIYTVVRTMRRPVVSGGAEARRERRLDPSELERLAWEAAARQDYITGIRFLFRASVVRLERNEKKSIRPGTTNRELLRRYRNRPDLAGALQLLVDVIDRKWYGDEGCTEGDFVACRTAHGDVCRLLEESPYAVRA